MSESLHTKVSLTILKPSKRFRNHPGKESELRKFILDYLNSKSVTLIRHICILRFPFLPNKLKVTHTCNLFYIYSYENWN